MLEEAGEAPDTAPDTGGNRPSKTPAGGVSATTRWITSPKRLPWLLVAIALVPVIVMAVFAQTQTRSLLIDAAGRDVTAEITGEEGYTPTNLLPPGATATITIVAGEARPGASGKTVTIEALWNPQDPTGVVRARCAVTVKPEAAVSTREEDEGKS